MPYKDPEMRRERQREYERTQRDPDKRREVHARYRERNRDAIRERQAGWERENADAKAARGLMYKHGMRPEQWWQMWNDQNGLCYLCDEPMDSSRPRSVHVDHDQAHCPEHRSCAICRRGLAHSACNRIIGQAKDDPNWLRSLADSLEAANATVAARMAVMSVQEELPLNVQRLARREESA